MSTLPLELLLEIVSHIPIRDQRLSSLALCSRTCNMAARFKEWRCVAITSPLPDRSAEALFAHPPLYAHLRCVHISFLKQRDLPKLLQLLCSNAQRPLSLMFETSDLPDNEPALAELMSCFTRVAFLDMLLNAQLLPLLHRTTSHCVDLIFYNADLDWPVHHLNPFATTTFRQTPSSLRTLVISDSEPSCDNFHHKYTSWLQPMLLNLTELELNLHPVKNRTVKSFIRCFGPRLRTLVLDPIYLDGSFSYSK